MATYEIKFSKTVREYRIVTVSADTPRLAANVARKLVKDEDEEAGGHSEAWCDGDDGRIRAKSIKRTVI